MTDQADTTQAATPKDELEQLLELREKRKTAFDKEARGQTLKDMLAINEAEEKHGDNNVSVLEFEYVRGLPTRFAVRTPTDPEIKKYRARLQRRDRAGNADPSGPVEAAHELVDCVDTIEARGPVLVYPDAETFARMCSARPGIKVQAGVAAVGLSTARAEAAGKG